MRKSIKAILGAGVLSSSLMFGNLVSAESAVGDSGAEIKIDENVKKNVENLGNVEEAKIDSFDELKSIEAYEKELRNVRQNIRELEELKEVYKTNKVSVKNDIVKINEELEIARNKIVALENNIKSKKEEIEETKEKLFELYKEIEKMEVEKADREENFKGRVKSIQKNKDVSIVEVLITSDSFVDMVNRFFSYKTIVNADNKAIEEYLALIEKLEKAKDKTEKLKEKLEVDLEDLKEKKESLKKEKESYDELLTIKERQSMTIDEVLKDIDRDISKLNSSIDKLTVNKNQASILDELTKKVEQERVNSFSNRIYRYADLSHENHVNATVEEEIKQGKIFITPAVGRFSSGYGPRVVMGEYGVHYGIDLANKIGTAIMASAEGEVIHAGPMGGYGNVIFLKHSIDGKEYVTVYGHLSMIGVKVGDLVDQTQTIGLMGNTGRSTGPHVHFEIHENTSKWNTAKSVDAWKYLTNNLSDGILRDGYKELDKLKNKFDN